MALDPPPDDWTDSSLDSLMLRIQEHAGSQGYAVVKARTVAFKDKLVRKAWLRCDHGGKPEKNSKSMGKRLTSSRLDNCPFEAIAQRTRIHGIETDWALTIVDPTHNHEATLAGSHPSLRAIAMTQDIRDSIVNQTRIGNKPSKIIHSLQLDHDDENPMLKARDVYNIKAEARSKALGSLTPIQALMRQLIVDEDWFVRKETAPTTERLESLFFVRKSSQKILEHNSEVLILDATYKTNKHNLPLLVITGVTALNTSFYVGFAFMKAEHIPDYQWVLQQLRDLYDELDIPFPVVLLTDSQDSLISACGLVFPEAKHMLCIWHIENNITTNCSKYFAKREELDTFKEDFKRIMFATTEQIYEHEWDALQTKYTERYPFAVNYVADHLITKKERFVAFWTNQHLHFNNHATSRGEANNGKLKRQLNGSSIGRIRFGLYNTPLTAYYR